MTTYLATDGDLTVLNTAYEQEGVPVYLASDVESLITQHEALVGLLRKWLALTDKGESALADIIVDGEMLIMETKDALKGQP